MKNGPYNLVIAPEEYPGKKYRGRYCYEHHLVWWKNFKEVPEKGQQIHHINGNHRDNRVKNLILVSEKEHRQIHGDMSRKKSRVPLICPQCGVDFLVKGNNYRFAQKNEPKRKFFCSKQCSGKYNGRVRKI